MVTQKRFLLRSSASGSINADGLLKILIILVLAPEIFDDYTIRHSIQLSAMWLFLQLMGITDILPTIWEILP